jgi:nitric oxide reductase NorD protein
LARCAIWSTRRSFSTKDTCVAEAEDVITDVARHATVYAQALWRRHRATQSPPRTVAVVDVAQRIDLLIAAVFGTSYRIRTAQAPAPTTFLAKAFQRREGPRVQGALPATDGVSVWLPADAGIADAALALDRLRAAALQQAMRAQRGSAAFLRAQPTPLIRDVYLLLEAHAADEALVRALPGLAPSLNALRRAALAARPALASFPEERRELEAFVRTLLRDDCGCPGAKMPLSASPADSARIAPGLAAAIVHGGATTKGLGAHPLFKDWWTGELRAPGPAAAASASDPQARPNDDGAVKKLRTARLTRRPSVRESADDEDDDRQGAWMIQSAQPQEHAEDPFGLQRPTDRDEHSAAEEFADSLSVLAEARLVSTPGRPKEVLLSDDPPDTRTTRQLATATAGESRISYPEWDYGIGAYRTPGATVSLLPAQSGPQQWVDETLAEHRSMHEAIRRRFEMLRAHRTRLRKQLDGDEIDLEAYVDGHADYRAGLPMAQALYQTSRRSKRDMAVILLIDTSGSTDGWIAGNRRVIDVEREALLLVCIALEGMGEPYSVQAFSGQGPHQVTIRTLKRFDERYDNAIARRIAALEPEEYTRTGAALRHASATLMQQPAAHRLLLLLSDGKPNDFDRYEGRYGVEDTRQAVTEAKLQGVFPFCLTVDRHGANYLPAMFGARQYALLPRPELLPVVLLDWMRRLVMA